MFGSNMEYRKEMHDDPKKYFENTEAHGKEFKVVMSLEEFIQSVRNTLNNTKDILNLKWVGSDYYIKEMCMWMNISCYLKKKIIAIDYVQVKESERGKGHFTNLINILEPLFANASWEFKVRNICPNLQVFFSRRKYRFCTRRGINTMYNKERDVTYPSSYVHNKPHRIEKTLKQWTSILKNIKKTESVQYVLHVKHESEIFKNAMKQFMLKKHYYCIDAATYNRLKKAPRILTALYGNIHKKEDNKKK